MDQLGTAVHAKMSRHAEVPLVALLGLMHLAITRLLVVLGRRRRVDEHLHAFRQPADPHLRPLVLPAIGCENPLSPMPGSSSRADDAPRAGIGWSGRCLE